MLLEGDKHMLKAKITKEIQEAMDKTLKSFNHSVSKIRTGRASPNILDGIMVDYYGTPTPIKQVAQISTPEARLLQLQPFDKTLIQAIEKAILAANIGVTPTNDGNFVRIPFAALTEEKRKILVKDLKKYGEDAKVALRASRRDQIEIIKKSEKDKIVSEDESKKLQVDVQTLIDKFSKQIDDLVLNKEKDIMTV